MIESRLWSLRSCLCNAMRWRQTISWLLYKGKWRIAVDVLLNRPPLLPQPYSLPLHLCGIDDNFFRRLYRRPKPTFFSLAQQLVVYPAFSSTRNRTFASLVPLSATIRWLAGGPYLNFAVQHTLSVSITFHFIEKTVCDLDAVVVLHFLNHKPQHLRDISDGSRGNNKNTLEGCWGSLHGLAIRRRKPGRTEIRNSQTYFYRKGFFSLNCKAICDSFYRFSFVPWIYGWI